MVEGDASNGSMGLRSYSVIGTEGSPGVATVVPEPSAITTLLIAVSLLCCRCFSRLFRKTIFC